ncbi:AraC family transcriptional regulator [Acinetobacter gyllenbergii]|uniref:AraC family transcriptional regulator n=1 Tax=Acinetobacter gyllenbergii TaxID=134534 RepID=UPI000806C2E5|nr:helix-turn-helix transcriptional regulator [Acinetobacter gyllenbergii]OBY74818.1 AraC family transcriptional regulator [Acinetobacter gyllenbergii]
MRNIQVNDYQDVAREVMATGNDYADGHLLASHRHRRGQCLYAITGVVTVITATGSWVVPPKRALWIPAGIDHEVHMGGITKTRSAYILPETANAAGLPAYCAVINVSPLLHELLSTAVDLPVEYVLGSRDDYLMRLIIAEIALMPELPLNAPLPQEPRLAALCLQLLKAPNLDDDLDQIAAQVGMSRRNFTRIFRQQTGMSFSNWRQQACLLNALTRMELGQSITHVAIELGYSSSSAFTAAFKRSLGVAPRFYIQGK